MRRVFQQGQATGPALRACVSGPPGPCAAAVVSGWGAKPRKQCGLLILLQVRIGGGACLVV